MKLLTDSVKLGSFSKNWTTQYASWGWYTLKDFTLCKGISTFNRNTLCSSFSGSANPLIMLGGKKVQFDVITRRKKQKQQQQQKRAQYIQGIHNLTLHLWAVCIKNYAAEFSENWTAR